MHADRGPLQSGHLFRARKTTLIQAVQEDLTPQRRGSRIIRTVGFDPREINADITGDE